METIIPYETVENVMNNYNKQRSDELYIAEKYSNMICMDIENKTGKQLNEKTLINYILHAIRNS